MRPHTSSLIALALLAHAVPGISRAQDAPVPESSPDAAREWIAGRYESALFDDASDAWHFGALELGARRTRLAAVGRVNAASRFDTEGYQLEADLYPALPGVGYAYLSGAWSEGAPFPELRAAAEAFVALPAALEASAGVVYMDFGEDDVAIVVGSLSAYLRDYWLSARPSWTTGGGELALTLAARRYLRTADEFATLRLLAGSTPEEVATRGEPGLETLGLQADAQLLVAPRVLLLPVLGVAREEQTGGDARLRFTLGAGVMYLF